MKGGIWSSYQMPVGGQFRGGASSPVTGVTFIISLFVFIIINTRKARIIVKDPNRNIKWLIGPSSERNRKMRLYYPYWQHTDHCIFRFVSQLCRRSTLRLQLKIGYGLNADFKMLISLYCFVCHSTNFFNIRLWQNRPKIAFRIQAVLLEP